MEEYDLEVRMAGVQSQTQSVKFARGDGSTRSFEEYTSTTGGPSLVDVTVMNDDVGEKRMEIP